MVQNWHFEDSEWLPLCVMTSPLLICSLWTWFYFRSLQLSYLSSFFLIICPKFKPFYFSLGTAVTCESSFSFSSLISLISVWFAFVMSFGTQEKLLAFSLLLCVKESELLIFYQNVVTEWERLGVYETLYLFCSFKDYPFWCFCEILSFPIWKYPNFTGGSVGKTLFFHCREHRFTPLSQGVKIP